MPCCCHFFDAFQAAAAEVSVSTAQSLLTPQEIQVRAFSSHAFFNNSQLRIIFI